MSALDPASQVSQAGSGQEPGPGPGNAETPSLDGAVADTMIRSAVDHCALMTARAPEGMCAASAVAAIRSHDPISLGYFRYALAREAGRCLAAMDGLVRAVYLFEDNDEDVVPTLQTSLTLVVWAQRRTAALASIAACLDSELLPRYQKIVGPSADRMTSLLDVHVVDDDDMSQRSGFAAVVGAVHSPAVKVWDRGQPLSG